MKELVLLVSDLNKKMRIEVDMLDYAMLWCVWGLTFFFFFYLFFLILFFFFFLIDNEEACDHSHMTCHIMWCHKGLEWTRAV